MHLNRHINANVKPNRASIMRWELECECAEGRVSQWACKFTCRDEHQWTISYIKFTYFSKLNNYQFKKIKTENSTHTLIMSEA